MKKIRIISTVEEQIAGFQACVDAVARERRYLGFVEGPPLAQSKAFVANVLAGGGVHLVALDPAGTVVGWCDIVRDSREGFRHSGHLGMGLRPEFRGHGIGRALAQAALDTAWRQGIERVSLAVFASNARAIALYERLGFIREGIQRRARKLDGGYDDELLMALLYDPAQSQAASSEPVLVRPIRILEQSFIWDWCRQLGILEEDDDSPSRLRADGALTHRSRVVFAPNGPSGYEPAVADVILQVLGRWDEALLWITRWGVWPSSEDWPRFYAWRARHGSRLSLEDAPGHLAVAEDHGEFHDLLRQTLEYGWDADLVVSQGETLLPLRVHISHDGWVEVAAAEPVELRVPGLPAEPRVAADEWH